MMIYSHRGESKYAPENTMSAFYLSVLLNCDGIECDVRKTKDDKLVLIHDKTIDRTSNYNGKVSNLTLKQLNEFDFGNKKYKGEKIVTLTDFLKYFSNKNIKIFLEIKEDGYEELLLKTLSNFNISNLTIISFKYDILEKMRKISDNIKLAWLIYDLSEHNIIDAKKIGIIELICISITLDKSDVKKILNNNLRVGVWGIKNVAELRRINSLGVDDIICDSAYDAKKELKNV